MISMKTISWLGCVDAVIALYTSASHTRNKPSVIGFPMASGLDRDLCCTACNKKTNIVVCVSSADAFKTSL